MDETCHFCSKKATSKVVVSNIITGIEETVGQVCREHRKMLKQLFEDSKSEI